MWGTPLFGLVGERILQLCGRLPAGILTDARRVLFFNGRSEVSREEQYSMDATVVTCGTDDNDDDPLFWLYLGAQGVQTLFRCWRERIRLPKRKIYFPIMYRRRNAVTKIKCWWLKFKKRS